MTPSASTNSAVAVDPMAAVGAPAAPWVARQDWRDLLFAHWPVDAASLRSHIPEELDVDTFDGSAWLSIVPFSAHRSRPRGVPAFFGLDYLELNLRTYVRHGVEGGVWFFSLDADSRFAVTTARLAFGLPYVYADLRLERAAESYHLEARRRNGKAQALSATVAPGEPRVAQAGTLEHFLLERYTLFTLHLGRLWKGRIRHVPYPVQDATLTEFQDELVAADGLAALASRPRLCHYAAGVDVHFFPPELA
jgi:uncharacterized protein YqjF (DUF2071 family)